MAAAGMYGIAPNYYTNQIAMNDLSGLDLYSPTGMGIDPMLSMNSSIFGSSMLGMGGYYGGGMGMTYPTMGMSGNYEDYYRNYEKYQDFMIDNQVRQQQKMRGADLRLNSPQEGVQKQAAILHEKILRNEQQQILQAYASFKESVRSMYGSQATDEEISNRASTIYSQITGKSLVDDIRENGRDSLTQGFLQTVTFGLADGNTAEENISALTGQPVGREDKMKKIVGNVAGGAVVGGATFLALGPLFKALKFSAKSKTFWGVLIGAIAGVGTAIATSK
jgi:hypothetical protein